MFSGASAAGGSNSGSPRLSRIQSSSRAISQDNLASVASDALSCPICGDEMISLAQLNRHLDDAHNDFDTKDALMSWFQKAQRKVAAPLNRVAQRTTSTLSALSTNDRFQLNNDMTSPAGRGDVDMARTPGSGTARSPEPPESTILKTHWQREGVNDVCPIEGCGRKLSGRTGKLNCRKCGRLCCEPHTTFQMRLNSAAQPDPSSGVWSRVCQKCYRERDGYAGTIGVSRNRTQTFLRMRKSRIDTIQLEANKLEKRLEKLTLISAGGVSAPQRPAVSKRSSFYGAPSRKEIEQTVVTWEDDYSVTACPFCKKGFGNFSNRRHHCRLCGKVVCGQYTCSQMIPLQMEYEIVDPQGVRDDIRVCQDCHRVVTRRREKLQQKAQSSQIVRSYNMFVKYRGLVEDVLPKFNSILMSMANRNKVEYEDRDYQMAARYRKNLMEYFSELDKLSKSVKALPTTSTSEKRLHHSIILAIINYLQANMFTLQLMPKVHKPSDASPSAPKVDPELQVLQQQYDQVNGFLQDALKRRRFEDATALQESLDELRRAIEQRLG